MGSPPPAGRTRRSVDRGTRVTIDPRTVRPPAVAGTFYPAGPDDLRDSLNEALTDAVARPLDAPIPPAIIVPHAGYVYSAAIAASAYARIAPAHATIRRVVLLGPSHRVPVRGLAAPSVDAFETPLGLVAIDDAARSDAVAHRCVHVDDHAHALEHSLEVQLPFLQSLLDDVVVLPLAVGDATVEEVAEVLERCGGGSDTLVVISTDLSHYHRYDDAVALDARTAAAIVARDGDRVRDVDACGARPLRGLLRWAIDHGHAVEQIDLRNSGDTAGDRRRVVGYGAFAVA